MTSSSSLHIYILLPHPRPCHLLSIHSLRIHASATFDKANGAYKGAHKKARSNKQSLRCCGNVESCYSSRSFSFLYLHATSSLPSSSHVIIAGLFLALSMMPFPYSFSLYAGSGKQEARKTALALPSIKTSYRFRRAFRFVLRRIYKLREAGCNCSLLLCASQYLLS